LRADHSLVLCNPEPRDAHRPDIGWRSYGFGTRHRRCTGARLLAGGSPLRRREQRREFRRCTGARLVAGGSPLRLLRLTASGARLVDGWMAGEPVGESVAERRL